MTTPARRQYLDIKAQHPDALLLFRMGDFYEMFDEDARVAARDLHITLTSREFGKGERAPMAGIPYHALDGYLARLVDRGHRVAICEQLSEPGKGLVERGVVRVVTPGTRSAPNLVRPKEHNHLAAVVRGRNAIGLAAVDVTTGTLRVTELGGPDAGALLEHEIARLAPAECLIPAAQADAAGAWGRLTPIEDWRFDAERGRDVLCRRLGVQSLEGFGCAALTLAVGSAAAIVQYVERTDRGLAGLLRAPETYHPGAFMVLDAPTRRNLEVARAARGGDGRASLIGVLDRTRTPMGGRLLRAWLGQPLIAVAPLTARLDAVEALVGDAGLRARLDAPLRTLGDVERLVNRIRASLPVSRDLLTLASALAAVGDLDLPCFSQGWEKQGPGEDEGRLLASIAVRLDPCADLAALLRRAVCAEPGPRAIRPGFDDELDRLTASIADSQTWLANLQRVERERTGIKSLKVGYNKVFGFYLEVTRPNLAQTPPDYQRRQTMVNAERFITAELKEHETAVLNAEEAIRERERHVLARLQEAVEAAAPRLLTTSSAIAELDVLLAFAEVAADFGYVRPTLVEEPVLDICGGRHPVVEVMRGRGEFVPNDASLAARPPKELGPGIWDLEGDAGKYDDAFASPIAFLGSKPQSVAPVPSLLVLTGPNMAGKSTYLRQVALVVLLAQVGSFVPAERATVGIVDRIFTRIGAQDDISMGASTFMVEMAETANILRHATPRSLVLLDEVGRGTSTYDGLALARAVAEDLHDRAGCRTLFATHYLELTALADELPGAANASMAVADDGDGIAFLYRVQPGPADRSYGLHVARLAGLPDAVVARAEQLLHEWEATGSAPLSRRSGEGTGGGVAAKQLTFFGVPSPEERARAALEDLLHREVMTLNPVDLLRALRLLDTRDGAGAGRW